MPTPHEKWHTLVGELFQFNSGMVGGVHIFSGGFDFQPDTGDLIRGSLDPELSEEAATVMNTHFTNEHAIDKMKMTTVSTRADKKKPTYELTALLPIQEPPRGGEQKPATEPPPPR